MSGWSPRIGMPVAALAAALALSACGGGQRQDANAPSGNFPVQITQASFPSSQRLTEHTRLVITVRNAGSKTIPNVAVTITTPPYGTAVQPFGTYYNEPDVAYHSRAVWIVDQPPGRCGFSCQNGGFGGAVSADPHTWALGRLGPGASTTFSWAVTAVQPGHYRIAYRVDAGLYGKAHAQLAGGGIPQGTFDVAVNGAPGQPYIDNSGRVINVGEPGGPLQGAAGPKAHGGS